MPPITKRTCLDLRLYEPANLPIIGYPLAVWIPRLYFQPRLA